MAKKNHKYKKQNRRKGFPWLLAALGGGLLFLAVMLFARNGPGVGTPSLAVDQNKIDYGDVKFGVEKSFAIKVTNMGDGPLRFNENPYIEVVEGC